jgi:trehalose 6-phosphate phosphatase
MGRSSVLAELIDRTARQARASIFFFDFDGTVADIQENPETVQPVGAAKEAIVALAAAVFRVCVVSARPVDFLRSRFGDVPAIRLYGQYGLESFSSSGLVTDPVAERFRPVIAELTKRALGELPPEVRVEEQGFRLSLHYRRAPRLRGEVEQWAREAAESSGAVLQEGRMLVELKPPVKRDKGDVVLTETAGASVGWYFGDDISDLAAFGALRQRASADPEFTGVAVAVRNTESGDAVAADADVVLRSPADVAPLIERIVDAIAARRAGPLAQVAGGSARTRCIRS